MKDLIFWFIYWYGTWIFFNKFLRWDFENLKSKKFFPRGIFFATITLIIYLMYSEILHVYLFQILVGLTLCFLIGFLLSKTKNYYKKFKKDKFFIEFQSFNVVFQQTMVILSIILLKNYFGGSYQNYYYGIFFLLAHFLIIFAHWSTLRYLVLPITFFGGTLFSYLALNVQDGIVLNILIHQIVYIFWLYRVRDEEKI